MDRDEKSPPLISEEEHPAAAGLPSYQEATTGLQRQTPPAYLPPGSGRTTRAADSSAYPDEKARACGDDATSSNKPGPLTFSISLQDSRLLSKKMFIQPAAADDDHGATQNSAVTTRWWEVEYTSKYNATMKRLRPGGGGSPKVVVVVATFKYPEFILPSACGVTMTFTPPYEMEDNKQQQQRRASPAARFMHCTGLMTNKYAFDFPAMGDARYVWQTTHRGDGSDGEGGQGGSETGQKQQQRQETSMMEKGMLGGGGGGPTTTAATASQAAVPAPQLDFGSLFSKGWTPFTTQYLVDEREQAHVLAQYTRSAPWARERGKLKIFTQKETNGDGGLEELIEGIVISCAAMVGMQDRLGLVSSLVEAGAESYAGKGKGRA